MPDRAASCRTNNVDLYDQRCFEANQEEKSQNHAQDGVGIRRSWDPRVVAGKVRVDLRERAGKVDGHADQSGGVEKQGCDIQDADWRLAPVRFGHESQDDEQDHGRSDLGTVVDADLDAILHEFV